MSLKFSKLPQSNIEVVYIINENIEYTIENKNCIILSKVKLADLISSYNECAYLDLNKLFEIEFSIKKFNSYFKELLNFFIDSNIDLNQLKIVHIGNGTKYKSLSYLFEKYYL